MNIIAIIPARGGSKRFKRKNIAPLKGKPLISYPLETAIKSNIFNNIYVSTEDKEIAEIASSHGANTFKRSEELATDSAHELDACLELIDSLEESDENKIDYFCVIYPTAVLLEPMHLTDSYNLLKETDAPCTLMSVSEFNYHPYKTLTENKDGYLEMMFPIEARQQSQTYPKALASNGTFYWVHANTLRNNRELGYYQKNIRPFEIAVEYAVDIDYPHDLKRAELYLDTIKGKTNS